MPPSLCCYRDKRHKLTGYEDLYSDSDTDLDDEKSVPLLNESFLEETTTVLGLRAVSLEDKQCNVLRQALIRDGYSVDDFTDDKMMKRYYAASKGDMDKALAALKDTIEWRSNENINQYSSLFSRKQTDEMQDLANTIRFENATGKAYVRGYTHDGHATLVLHPSRENSSAGKDSIKHLVYNLERAIACSQRRSLNTVDSLNIIICFEGYTMSNAPSLATTKETISILQNHYPERLKNCYMVNTPSVFSFLWSIAKPFIDPVTRSKIVFIRGEKARETLSEIYDLDQVEEIANGRATRGFNSDEYLRHPFFTAFAEMDSVNSNPIKGETSLDDEVFFDAYSKHSLAFSRNENDNQHTLT